MPEIRWPLENLDQKQLHREEVHLWCCSLLMEKHRLKKLRLLLDTKETQRADRFIFDEHRRRFIVAHAGLRILLSQYLSQPPESLVFERHPRGKPYLSHHRIFFNMSHSEELVVFAITLEEMVGVDIEYLNKIKDFEALVERFFAKNEIFSFQNLSASEKRIGFFNGWTRKEAYIKAIGLGLHFPLNQFEVTLTPKVEPAILSIHQDKNAAQKWSLFSFEPASDYLAALAIQAHPTSIKTWQFQFNI